MSTIIKTWSIHVDKEEIDKVESMGFDDSSYDYDTERLIPIYIRATEICSISPNSIRWNGVDDTPCTDLYMCNGKHHLAMSKTEDILKVWLRVVTLSTEVTEIPKSVG